MLAISNSQIVLLHNNYITHQVITVHNMDHCNHVLISLIDCISAKSMYKEDDELANFEADRIRSLHVHTNYSTGKTLSVPSDLAGPG
jgi:hypothetical protein